jgi:hypothetical protein
MITLARFREIEDAVRAAGYSEHIARSERLTAPANAYQFATEAIYVIVNSGMRNSVARPIFERCIVALEATGSCKDVLQGQRHRCDLGGARAPVRRLPSG